MITFHATIEWTFLFNENEAAEDSVNVSFIEESF